ALMPSALLRHGLAKAISEHCESLDQVGGLTLVHELKLNAEPDEATSRAVFRIFQEVLSNMLKYAGATEIRVRLREEGGEVRLWTSDNGKGFDTKGIESSAGIGWENIRFRTQLLQGSFSVKSAPGEGSIVQVNLPLT